MNRVLVTGASGFIGRNALLPLLGRGMEVHATTSRARPPWSPADVRWHTSDLLSAHGTDMISAIEPTHLLHLAWYAEPGRFWGAPENVDWVAASLRLMRACTDAGCRRVVIAGTCAEYRWGNDTHCVEYVTPRGPTTLYGTAKDALHRLVAAYAATSDVSVAWGRIFFTFGPHEHPARLAASVARSLVRGEEALCSHGEQVRDFLYAPELADAFVALLSSDTSGPVNMASGHSLRIRDLVIAIARAAGHPELVRLGARPAGEEPARLTAEVSRLRDEVGWLPRLSLDEAAEQTVSWWRRSLR